MRPYYPPTYDPSAPYRAMVMPQVQPQPPMTYPYGPPNPVPQPQPAPANNNDRNGAGRIPQFFYPRDNVPSNSDPYADQQYFDQPPYDPYSAYGQPVPLGMNPYGQDPNYPYGAPYLVPLASNVHVDPAPPPPMVPQAQEAKKTDVIEKHKADADLSRLEVYHFTPKQPNPTTPAGQPIIQYHVYPYPPGGSAGPPPPPAVNSNANPWYGHQPDGTQPYYPPVEMKPRGMQTEAPEMKSRGISPMHLPETAQYESRTYPKTQYVSAQNDHYDIRPKRIHSRPYNSKHSPPLSDCRCLECRQRRDQVLNYYPE